MIGGLLVAASWRWVFFVNVPIGLLTLVAGWRLLPHLPGHDVPVPDPLGAVLITGGVGALTLALVQGTSWGSGSPRVLGVLVLSVVLLGLFAAQIIRGAHPLVERSLFAVRSFTGASLVALVFSAAVVATP